MIETRNDDSGDADDVLSQYVWGATYVDELVQVGTNDDPTDAGEHACETFYYALQDANYNAIGLVDDSGDLVERYEYTPYGQRTCYPTAGSDDPLCHCGTPDSRRVQVSSVDQPYSLCDFGHQGLMHDKEFGLVYNRRRFLHPRLGRFMQRDPLGYVDGMSLYEYVGGNPMTVSDPSGTQPVEIKKVVVEANVVIDLIIETSLGGLSVARGTVPTRDVKKKGFFHGTYTEKEDLPAKTTFDPKGVTIHPGGQRTEGVGPRKGQ